MNISEIKTSFKEIERITQKHFNKLGCERLKEVLETWDANLMESRDKTKYRHHGRVKTVIKTVMGEVEYERVEYQILDGDGKTRYVYLLDEAMGETGVGYFSELLSEQIVQACCESSYRNAARAVSEMTGQTISHAAAWTVVQEFGAQVDEEEKRSAELAAENKGVGAIETKLLFEEHDGIWLSMQGKSRKDRGDRVEMKVAIAYDGAEKVGKKRYKLTNKVACANFGPAGDFIWRKDGVVAGTYNVDEIEIRILGGDGASWIKQSQTDDSVHFQLDQYHRNKAIVQYVSDPDARETIRDLLYAKDIELLLSVIETYSLSTDDEEERENYQRLYIYFQNNKDGLVPYHRRGLQLPAPPEGKEYRRMGAMESNIFTLIGNRMKGRRHCWSINGGNNLARLLCLKHTGKLTGILDSLSAHVLPARYAQEVTVDYSASVVPQHEGKGYNGFKQSFIPSSMKWMKDLVGMKPLSEMKFN